MLQNKIAIIVQGPANNVKELKLVWEGYTIIWSTWVGNEDKFTSDDIVIFSEQPYELGVQNIALQKKSTLEGVNKAKELGFERVLKWRSDLLPTNANELVKLFKKNQLNFLAWHNEGKYFVDYFMEGPIDEVKLAWDIPIIYGPFSERITTDNIFDKNKIKYNFILDELSDNNEIFWVKYNVYLSKYKDDVVYTTKIIL
jgi:hypothetical protein